MPARQDARQDATNEEVFESDDTPAPENDVPRQGNPISLMYLF